MRDDLFEQQIKYMQQALDGFVVNGSDQELFIASYLHGHFDLVVSQVMQSGLQNLNRLDQSMLASLQQAFSAGELEPDDQQMVSALWQQLLKQAPR